VRRKKPAVVEEPIVATTTEVETPEPVTSHIPRLPD
jgi:hypothetical protein